MAAVFKELFARRKIDYESPDVLEACVDVAEELGVPAEQVVDAIDAAANGVPASKSMVQRARQQMAARMRSAKKPSFGGVSSTPMKYDAASLHKLAGGAQSSFSTRSQMQTPSSTAGFAGTKRPNSAISGGTFTGKHDAAHGNGTPGELPSVALAAAMDKAAAMYDSRASAGTVVDSFNADLETRFPLFELSRKLQYSRPTFAELRDAGLTLHDKATKLSEKAGYATRPTTGPSDPLPIVCASVESYCKVMGSCIAAPLQRQQLHMMAPVTFSMAAARASCNPAAPVSQTSPSTPGAPPDATKPEEVTVDPEVAIALAAGLSQFDGSNVPDSAFADSMRAPTNRNVRENYQYMFTTAKEKADNLEGRQEEMADLIVKYFALGEQLVPVGTTSQNPVVYVGRICVASETGDGKINRTSVLLEGTRDDAAKTGINRVQLDLSEMNGFSLFPGQVVGVRGLNARGDKMVVQAIYHGCPPPPVCIPQGNAWALGDVYAKKSSGPLRVWVASGPFCVHANLDFKPLKELFAEAQAADGIPDVIVLVRLAHAAFSGVPVTMYRGLQQGPFVDADHPRVKSGDLYAPSSEGVAALTCTDLWQSLVLPTIEDALGTPALKHTRLVIMSAWNDSLSHPIIPTSPLIDFSGLQDTDVLKRVITVSNPSTFVIGDVVFASTSTDVLFALNKDECSLSKPTLPGGGQKLERMCRLAQHVIEQRNFVPMFPTPASEGEPGLPVELLKLWNCGLEVAPDVLILPSKLKTFAKQLGHSVVINPGLLTKGNAGGTYARISVYPVSRYSVKPLASVSEDHAPSDPKETFVYTDAPSRTKVEVVKI